MDKKNSSDGIYTLGIWMVKSGQEKIFIKEWKEFAEWSARNFSLPGKAYLLQDENNPQRFISFGPWDDPAVIRQWRETQEFKIFLEKVKDLCDEFTPNTLKVVASSE